MATGAIASGATVPLRRVGVALGVLAALGVGAGWLTLQPESPDAPLGLAAPRALGHRAAAVRQNVYPTTHAEAVEAADARLADDLTRVGPGGGGWFAYAIIAGSYLDHARLTGSFDDYARAGATFERAFAVADAGIGPHLERAAYNLSVHRLAAAEPDLDRIERHAIPPDLVTRATMLGMRGDIAFYRGNYAQALDLYQQSRRLVPGIGPAVRLANYWSAMGDPDRALGFVDEAQYYVTGAQQQVLAGLERQRGTIAFARGEWDRAQAHFARAADIFPGNWTTEQHLALLAALRGDRARAQAMFERVVARDGSPEAMDALAGLARADGDFARSQAWAARAGAVWQARMRLLPEAAYGHALEHLLAFGDPKETLRVAVTNHAAQPFGDSATQLASAYLANRRPADALRTIEPVLASGWVSSDAHVVAMEAYALSGQSKRADAERRAALAINPHALDRNPAMVWLGH